METEQKPTRTCGSCKACCTALIVHALKKPEWKRCAKLGPLGCKVYRTRPEECQNSLMTRK